MALCEIAVHFYNYYEKWTKSDILLIQISNPNQNNERLS